MFRPTAPTRLIDPSTPAGASAPAGEDTWDVLERFAREVTAAGRSAAQIRCALRAARDGLRAPAVFWYPGPVGEKVESLGDHDLPPDWCRTFARALLDETPGVDGRLLRTALPPAANRALPSPRSAALVRLSRSQDSWLVALSFPPGRDFAAADLKVLGLVRQILLNQSRRDRLCGRLSDTLLWLVQCMTASIDAKLPHAKGHGERVAQAAVQIGRGMQLPGPLLSDLYFAGLLHDIGLTGVEESLLRKTGRLTDAELAQIRQSPVIGDRILAGVKPLAHLRPAVRSHHEWYDGRGYPDGLAGESIPLLARILAVADSYDALLSPRPYRPALSPEAGDAVLAGGAGKQWDPLVVDRFLACRPTIEPIWQRNADSRVLPDMKCAFAGWDQDTGLELATFTGGQTRGTEDKGQGTEKPDSSLSSVLCPLSSGGAVEFWRSDGPP